MGCDYAMLPSATLALPSALGVRVWMKRKENEKESRKTTTAMMMMVIILMVMTPMTVLAACASIHHTASRMCVGASVALTRRTLDSHNLLRRSELRADRSFLCNSVVTVSHSRRSVHLPC